jgi:trehalose synthase
MNMRVELVKPIKLDDYAKIVGKDEIHEVKALADSLKQKSVTHVNSTAFGGGVAEILNSMVPLMKDVGLDVHWEVIQGAFDFFNVTKKIHNALQGMNVPLTEEEQKIYLDYNKANAASIVLDSDFVVVHDNQPAALINFQLKKDNIWVWRCHIDLSTPNLAVWAFLEQYIRCYEGAIFTAKEYVMPSLSVPKIQVSPPSINPLNEKNRDLSDDTVKGILEKFGVNPEKPIITQVARFDPWKDPLGAVDVYRLVKKEVPNLQLLLIAGMATDDPEGWLYLEKTARHIGEDPDVHLLTDLKGVNDLEVNAFQRASQVALQLSTREGFGLTVAEALWKKVPVVGRKVGGIPLQVLDCKTGYLVDTVDQAAEKTLYLLKHPDEAKQMGANGKEHVRKNFLVVGHLKDHLKIFKDLETLKQGT